MLSRSRLAVRRVCAVALAATAHAHAAALPADTRETLQEEHRKVADALGELSAGLEHALKTDDLALTQRLYTIERSAVALLERTAEAPLSDLQQREEALSD